jgi:glycerol-3-phosphate dehydrogenase
MLMHDVAVIGAGVVGCAMARRFALDGARVVVLEKAVDILDGASKGNSGILHTGFDAPVGSLEQACVAAGRAEYLAIRENLGLPLIETGALVLAWSEAEEARLPELVEQASKNGVVDVEMLSAAAIRAIEPALGAGLRGGFRVPGEHVIDPWSAPHAYLLQALMNGAELRRSSPVTGASFDGQAWRLATPQGAVLARMVISCAGLYGDSVAEMLFSRPLLSIRPRKGQFVVFDKSAASLARHILLPVPTPTTKGIVVSRTAYGNLIVGPTAEEQNSRTEAATDRATLERLIVRGREILPGLADHEVTATYAGLRPASEEKEYRIEIDRDRNVVSVAGIRSTGLSAALGIASHVARLVSDPDWTPVADPASPTMPMIAEEDDPRDWTMPGHGGIVCHCEMVTRREIETALSGPLPPATLAGLKRKTRVTMGRCQGFYCLGTLARLTEGRLAVPIAEPAGSGHD